MHDPLDERRNAHPARWMPLIVQLNHSHALLFRCYRLNAYISRAAEELLYSYIEGDCTMCHVTPSNLLRAGFRELTVQTRTLAPR